MRIALTHPFCWPSVRRGSERFIEALAPYLVSRGHDVVTVSTVPDGPKEERGPGGRRILHGPAWHPLLGKLRIEPTHTFIPNCARTLLSLELDSVVSFFFSDGFAAQLAARRRGFKTIQQLHGAPMPYAFHRLFPPDRAMIRSVLRNADCLISCSYFVAGLIDEYYGVEVEVVHPSQNLEDFTLGSGPPDGRPTILGVANFDIPRKGVRPLVRAFQLVQEKEPEARLRLSGQLSPETEREIRSLVPERTNAAIEVLGLGNPEDVPRQYQEASLLALPSMWEPSGNVMCEAWAAGTPVVATNHAGLPEFFGEGVGFLFEPETDGEETQNVEGLADALLRGLHLSQQEGVRERCRAHAEQWPWEVVGRRYEALYAP